MTTMGDDPDPDLEVDTPGEGGTFDIDVLIGDCKVFAAHVNGAGLAASRIAQQLGTVAKDVENGVTKIPKPLRRVLGL